MSVSFKATIAAAPPSALDLDAQSPAGVKDAGRAVALGHEENDRLNPERALAYFRRALELSAHHNDAVLGLSVTLHDLGRIEEGQAALRAALDDDPGRVALRFQLGKSLSREGRLEEAVAELERCVQDHGDYHDPYRSLVLALNRLGRTEQAAEVVETLKARGGDARTVALLERMVERA